MALLDESDRAQSMVLPDRGLAERLRTFADHLEAGAQVTPESQQLAAFRLSKDRKLSNTFREKIRDTDAVIPEMHRCIAAMTVARDMQEQIHNNAERARHIMKDIHFSTRGSGTAKLILHTAKKGEVFDVTLRPGRGELGVRYNKDTFSILEILDGGHVQIFNKTQSPMQICVGDTVINVNGVQIRCVNDFIRCTKGDVLRIKFRKKPSGFCRLDDGAICLNKIMNSELLWVAPKGAEYDPANVTVCNNVHVGLDAANAVHPARLGFTNGPFLNAPRYTLCDGMSVMLCQLLRHTWRLELGSESPHEACDQHVKGFIEIWYEKNLGIKRVMTDRSRSPSRFSAKSQKSCMTSNSEASSASILLNPEDKCFIGDTMLKSHSGHFVQARQLEMGARVSGASGKMLQVVSVQVYAHAHESDLVDLCADDARLKVTASHRVMVIRGGQEQAVPASSLRIGDDVVCSGGEMKKVSGVLRSTERVEVVKVAFHPDEPVEAFLLPTMSILSLGYKSRVTRRSGMQPSLTPAEIDGLSIPDTADPFSE